MPSRKKKMCIVWRKRIKRSRTTTGSPGFNIEFRRTSVETSAFFLIAGRKLRDRFGDRRGRYRRAKRDARTVAGTPERDHIAARFEQDPTLTAGPVLDVHRAV